ncbi:MAG: type II toxin-antitoxin system HicA family toxin [Akkermansiaceae bacterium]|nr:type II toxin-antitoxin system HicA family toxin [Akkermansiaceae bacterium]MCP5551103.1 type II toxin-antitoxin system HicA family toxin [Akkermansiaceae bacterium]
MKAVSGKRLAQLAEAKGWRLTRVNGSHHVFVKADRIERVVIPIHGDRTLKIGLQRAPMKIIPVSEEEL